MGFVHIQKYLATVAHRKCCSLVAHDCFESFYLFIGEFYSIFSFSWHGINDLDPTFYLCRKDKKNISKYQYYITLEAYLSKRIESEKNTGNTPYIVLGTLADMEIKLPKVHEQQRIAHDLSVLSQKIENETHMFKLFIQEKKTLLGKMFI